MWIKGQSDHYVLCNLGGLFAQRNTAKAMDSLGLGKIFVRQVLIYVSKKLGQNRKNLAYSRTSNHHWQGDCIAKMVSWVRPLCPWTILGFQGSGCVLKKIRWIPNMFLKQNNVSDSQGVNEHFISDIFWFTPLFPLFVSLRRSWKQHNSLSPPKQKLGVYELFLLNPPKHRHYPSDSSRVNVIPFYYLRSINEIYVQCKVLPSSCKGLSIKMSRQMGFKRKDSGFGMNVGWQFIQW